MTGPREVQWRRFCETMAPQRDELERRAALCRALWPQDCALTMKTAGELRENTFLFQLPWDMEQRISQYTLKMESTGALCSMEIRNSLFR